MKNNKGFTLVELLAVLVILIAIITIAIPSITSSIERSKDKELEAKRMLVVSGAELFVSTYKGSTNILTNCMVTVNQLKNAKILLVNDIKDPKTNAEITGCVIHNAGNYNFSTSCSMAYCLDAYK